MLPSEVADIVPEDEVSNVLYAWKYIDQYSIFRRYRNIGITVEVDIKRAKIFSIIEAKLDKLCKDAK